MTFSDKIKKELAGLQLKNACCRRKTAYGLIYGAVEVSSADFTLTAGSEEVCEFVQKVLSEQFSDIQIRLISKKGSSKKRLHISSPKAAAWMSDALFEKADAHSGRKASCPGCTTAFMRGVFIACATVSDPRSASYHAEFILRDAQRAIYLYRLLSEADCVPGIINRKGGTGLYFKNSGKIEALLVKLGANLSAFELMNCKIERTIRNDENRATNCVAQNIARTVIASRRQVEDIQELIKSGKLEKMSFEIRTTAKLRLDNPEASLLELAELHKPPISKSGLNHRLAKIRQEAERDK